VRATLGADEREWASAVVKTAAGLAADNPSLAALRTAALHARGLYEDNIEALRSAALDHRDPWAAASATEDLAVALTRDDQDSGIRHLDEALTRYQECGALWDAARVRRRLRGLGVQRRHWQHSGRPFTGWDSLTKAERSVADLVAQGLTNRQVARQMFVSPHTVSYHLRQVYRKLGIHSRIDLALQKGSAGRREDLHISVRRSDAATIIP
jgi:DNA-binding CsgD family transcriptional regulator